MSVPSEVVARMIVSAPVVAALAVSLLGGGQPEAEDAAEVPVGASYSDDISERERRQLDESFAEALDKACDPKPCTKNCKPGKATVGVEVEGDSRNYTLHWVANDERLDAPLVVDSTCELCSLPDVEAQFATDLGSLCTALAALEEAPGRVKVSSDPDGARVIIDGLSRGRTPWTGELPAGEHEIELRARGHQPQARTVVVVANVEASEHIELTRTPEVSMRPVWPAWTSIGLGVVLGVAGTALIALHGKEWSGRCSDENIDANGHCRYVYATRPLGIGLAAVGVGAVAAGAGLMVWAERKGGRLSSFGVGVQGRF